MNNPKTPNVLAVLDEIIERMVDDGWSGIRDAREARAAVAELIEAADGVDATQGPMLNGAVDPKVQQLALDRLRAVLARVGGA